MFSTFPSSYSVPPAEFYNIQGLSTWLNQNVTYKHYFINYPKYFPLLYAKDTTNEFDKYLTSTMSSQAVFTNYNLEKVSLPPFVTTLSQYQARVYREQLSVFQKVYAYNSNAYFSNQPPIYYAFQSYNEMMQYKSGVALANKLYNFDAMANGKNEAGSTLGWIVPFPL